MFVKALRKISGLFFFYGDKEMTMKLKQINDKAIKLLGNKEI
jgi:hypothetical protein